MLATSATSWTKTQLQKLVPAKWTGSQWLAWRLPLVDKSGKLARSKLAIARAALDVPMIVEPPPAVVLPLPSAPVSVPDVVTAVRKALKTGDRFTGPDGYAWSVQSTDKASRVTVDGGEYDIVLEPGDKWPNDSGAKTRAEIAGLTVPPQGRSIIEYDVQILEGDFVTKDKEHVIGQRHGKADKHDDAGEHPSIAVRVLSGYRLGLTVSGSSQDPLTKAEIETGGKSRYPWTSEPGEFAGGEWIKIKIDSLAAGDGWVDLYINGELMKSGKYGEHTYAGPFGYVNVADDYWKFGDYCARGTTERIHLRFRNIKRTVF